MRKNIMWGIAVGAVIVLGSGGGAFAGEIGGNGQGTQGPAHAKSACVYSGLEDGSEDPEAPSGPGAVQNWGHTKDAPFVESVRGAAEVKVTFAPGFTFTTGCNPHVGVPE